MKHIKRILVIIIIAALVFAGILSYIKIENFIYPTSYSNYVEKYSKEYGVDKTLVFAVIKCESSFDENAVSSVGALGLMQMTPETFEWVQTKLDGKVTYSDDDLYTPEINIKYATYLLSLHLEEFKDTKTALAAYHAGRGNVNKWLKMSEYSSDGKTLDTTPFKETNAYCERVVKVMDKYDFLLNSNIMIKLRSFGL